MDSKKMIAAYEGIRERLFGALLGTSPTLDAEKHAALMYLIEQAIPDEIEYWKELENETE